MTFVIVAAASLLAVVLFHLVAGWVLANGLRRSALDIGERPPELGVWVRAFSEDEITLTAKRARQDIGHPGTTAIVFARGSGRLGDVVSAGHLEVTREVLSMSGSPPVCVHDLANCEPVELNSYVFLTDPSDLGLSFSETPYLSELGDMAAWTIPGEPGNRWAIHVHGWTAHRQELLRMQPVFNRAGFTSMIINYRNDAGMPQDPTGRYRFGLTEWRDLESAVQTALDSGATDLVLTGCSTGGGVVMAFLENSPLATHVMGVVLDAPNIILADAIRLGTSDLRATNLMIEFGMWIADLRWKVDWDTTNWVQRAETFLKVPTLVFHGTSDHRVPISVSRQLEARVSDHVDLIETTAAGHVMSWNANPERYERHLARFLSRI